MSEKRFSWNYFESDVTLRDNKDKKWIISLIFHQFLDIPNNKEALDEIVSKLNTQQAKIQKQERIIKALEDDHKRQENEIKLLRQEYSKIPPKIREVWRD